MKKTSTNIEKTSALVFSLVMVLAIFASVPTAQAEISTKIYTVNAEFDEGILNGVNHDEVNDQLQLNKQATTFPVMWIANAGEDTVSKIDTKTGKELARYRTWFGPSWHSPWDGPAPSRTSVDLDGNAYVANRHFDGKPASVVKILADGGIDRNGNGVIDTATDTNGNGVIDTVEILPMVDSNGNGMVDASEINDERIAWIVQVGPPNGLGRSLAIDTDGNLWLGLFNARVYYKLSSADGSILAGPIDVSPNTPYGALVDKNGILWGASLDGTLLKLDTNTNTKLNVYSHPHGDYGIALGNDRVYMACFTGCSYIEFNPATGTFSLPAKVWYTTLGIAVDADGNIVVGKSNGGVTKFRPDGSIIWDKGAQPSTTETRGVAIDSDNNIWGVHVYDDKISKFNGADGASLGVFPIGHGPYTYSDATGFGYRSSITPTGTWNVIYDSTAEGTTWSKASWTEIVPAGASIEVKIRSADTEAGLQLVAYQPVSNDVEFSATGRFIQMDTRLTANQLEESPVLYDMTISYQLPVLNQPPIAEAGGPYEVNEGDSVNLDGSGSSDPDKDALIYDWDLNNDGTYETPGMIVSASWPDGPATKTVGLKVSDGKGGESTDTAQVIVINVAPAVNAGPDQAVTSGDTVGFSGSYTDPADISDAPYTIQWDFGDGSSASGTLTPTYVYPVPGIYTVALTITDKDGGAGSDTLVVTVKPIQVAIDIKPGSFPNSINLGNEGTVPVAIFSSADFDATTVDPLTVTLASAPVKLKGKGTPMSSKEDKNGDGLLDLVVHVSTEALQISETDTEAVLEGKTYDGRYISGIDSVRIVQS